MNDRRAHVRRALEHVYARGDLDAAGSTPPITGPAVDPVHLKGALPLRADARVGVVPLSGRDCWPQGQLRQTLLL
jgi:hypothetical protein